MKKTAEIKSDTGSGRKTGSAGKCSCMVGTKRIDADYLRNFLPDFQHMFGHCFHNNAKAKSNYEELYLLCIFIQRKCGSMSLFVLRYRRRL